MQVNGNVENKKIKFDPVKTVGAIIIGGATSPLGEALYYAAKDSKLEKTPFKDSFMKQVAKEGKDTQSFLKCLNKFSTTKVGLAAIGIISALDIAVTYLIGGWLTDTIRGKKS